MSVGRVPFKLCLPTSALIFLIIPLHCTRLTIDHDDNWSATPNSNSTYRIQLYSSIPFCTWQANCSGCFRFIKDLASDPPYGDLGTSIRLTKPELEIIKVTKKKHGSCGSSQATSNCSTWHMVS
jgi:hypothetical protein